MNCKLVSRLRPKSNNNKKKILLPFPFFKQSRKFLMALCDFFPNSKDCIILCYSPLEGLCSWDLLESLNCVIALFKPASSVRTTWLPYNNETRCLCTDKLKFQKKQEASLFYKNNCKLKISQNWEHHLL